MRTSQLIFQSDPSRTNYSQPQALATRYQKFYQPKTQTEGSSPSPKPPSLKFAYSSLTKDNFGIKEVSKSQTFINTFSQSRESLGRQKSSVFGRKYVSQEGSINFRSLKDTQNDMMAKRSVQFLISINRSCNKTQYSKIVNRKEEIIKKNTIVDVGQKIEPIHKVEDFSEQKLIQKYKELVLKKEKEGPFNMINKLYQIELLTSKEAVIMPKHTIQGVSSKLNQNKSNNSIEFKVSKIIKKPYDLDRVKQILQTSQNKSFLHPPSKPQKTICPQSLEKQTQQRRPVQTIRRQLREKTETSSSRIAELRTKQPLTNKIQSLKFESPTKEQVQNRNFPPPKKVTAAAYIIYEVFKEENKQLSPSKRWQMEGSRKKEACSGKIHAAFNIKTAAQIASLTKIMTCIVVIELCQRLNINTYEQKYKIGYFQSSIKGTSAEIEPGDIYTIHELLLGLMLPSGNDASLALARWAGNVLLISDSEQDKKKSLSPQGACPNKDKENPEGWAINNKYLSCKEQKLKARRCYNRFLAEMNKKTRLLGLQRTTYVNSHGLSNPHNKSSCLDQALLCQYAIKNAYFCQIVSSKEYESTIDKEIIISNRNFKKTSLKVKRIIDKEEPEQMNLEEDAEDDQMWNKSSSQSSEEEPEQPEEHQKEPEIWTGDLPSISPIKDTQTEQPENNQEKKVVLTKKTIKWVNTHKLLHSKKQYFGIKTGVTATAGACLASYFKTRERTFIIVVLNCKKMSLRFTDTQILRRWVSSKQRINNSESVLSKGEDDS